MNESASSTPRSRGRASPCEGDCPAYDSPDPRRDAWVSRSRTSLCDRWASRPSGITDAPAAHSATRLAVPTRRRGVLGSKEDGRQRFRPFSPSAVAAISAKALSPSRIPEGWHRRICAQGTPIRRDACGRVRALPVHQAGQRPARKAGRTIIRNPEHCNATRGPMAQSHSCCSREGCSRAASSHP